MARTIVVGYDWSPHARRALERARAYAPDGPTVVVVSVAPTEPTPADILIQKRALDEAEKELGGGAIKIEVVAASGDASGSIVDSARDADADLVVVGSRGRSGLTAAVLGSVSTAVVQHAPCDVLVVR